MGKMASQLAHELNNPIFGIMNCLELTKDSLPDTHERKKYLDLAYNECRRSGPQGLLVKMLKFFKPDDEKKSLTDINKLIEETLLFYEKQFQKLQRTRDNGSCPGTSLDYGSGEPFETGVYQHGY